MEQPYVDELRNQLVGAAERQQTKAHRRQRLVQRAGALLLIVVVVMGLIAVMNEPKSYAAVLHVERRGSILDVSLNDLTATPDQVRRELSDAGITADVNTLPVARPAVGQFVALETGPALTPLNVNDDLFRRFTIDTNVSRAVALSLGRDAKPGERYAKFFDAYSSGGPLYCAGVWGTSPPEAETLIKSRFNGNVEWKYAAPAAPPAPTTPQASADKKVVDAQLLSSTEMLVFVADEAKSPFVQSEPANAQQCS